MNRQANGPLGHRLMLLWQLLQQPSTTFGEVLTLSAACGIDGRLRHRRPPGAGRPLCRAGGDSRQPGGVAMGKTVLRVRQEDVSYFLNTESSSPSTGHRNRYRLFKTTNFGRDKSGWVQIGSIAGQALIALTDEADQFAACAAAFDSKKPRAYERHGKIRGAPGPWEGDAFPARRSSA